LTFTLPNVGHVLTLLPADVRNYFLGDDKMLPDKLSADVTWTHINNILNSSKSNAFNRTSVTIRAIPMDSHAGCRILFCFGWFLQYSFAV
jgi:hypothetical protein